MSLKNLLQADDRKGWRRIHQMHQTDDKQARFLIAFVILIVTMMLRSVGCIVVHQVRFISRTTGRTDYAVAGESIELSCHYLMKDDDEDIKSVYWSKDGMNFARWSKYKGYIEVLDYTFKGHFDNSTTHSHLIIHNVTIDMHGSYQCSFRTDLTTFSNQINLTVVTQSPCKLDDWRVKSEQLQCRETFIFDCRHMFPRPNPRCGLWNSRTEKFISSLPMDISEEPALPTTSMQTYRVRYVHKFDLTDQNGGPNEENAYLLAYAGHLVFKCDIIVPETSWRLSLTHKMFDFSDGCEQDPLEAIRKMRASYNEYARDRLRQQQQRPGAQSNQTEWSSTTTGQYQQQHHNHRGLQTVSGQYLQTIDDQQSLESMFNVEILLPSEVRKLAYRNRYGGEGEHELDPYLFYATAASMAMSTERPPPKHISEDVNCWQKPRLGSIVKLSCANNGPMGSPGNPRRRHHQQPYHSSSSSLKLMGSNLLECKANGWNLIRESYLINNEILDKKTYNVRVNRRRKLAASNLWPQTTTPMTSLSKTETTTTTTEATTTTTSSTTAATTKNAMSRIAFDATTVANAKIDPSDLSNRNRNDLNEEDNDDDNSAPQPMGATDATAEASTRLPTTETEEDLVSIPILPAPTATSDSPRTTEQVDGASEGGEEEPLPPGNDDFMVGILQARGKPKPEELSPSQLADLLPVCVSVSQKRRNQAQKSAGGGLPLLNNEAIMQESTDGRHFGMSHGVLGDRSQHHPSIDSSSAGSLLADISEASSTLVAVIVCFVAIIISTLLQPSSIIKIDQPCSNFMEQRATGPCRKNHQTSTSRRNILKADLFCEQWHGAPWDQTECQ